MRVFKTLTDKVVTFEQFCLFSSWWAFLIKHSNSCKDFGKLFAAVEMPV